MIMNLKKRLNKSFYAHSEPTIEQLPSEPERPEVIRVPASPARRLKSISNLEKLIAAFGDHCRFDISDPDDQYSDYDQSSRT